MTFFVGVKSAVSRDKIKCNIDALAETGIPIVPKVHVSQMLFMFMCWCASVRSGVHANVHAQKVAFMGNWVHFLFQANVTFMHELEDLQFGVRLTFVSLAAPTIRVTRSNTRRKMRLAGV